MLLSIRVFGICRVLEYPVEYSSSVYARYTGAYMSGVKVFFFKVFTLPDRVGVSMCIFMCIVSAKSYCLKEWVNMWISRNGFLLREEGCGNRTTLNC